MKKIYSLLAIATISMSAVAQSTLFSENMGTPSASPLDISKNVFQNAAPISFSGTADVRNNLGSTGYTGASAGGNILFNDKTDTFIIGGINTSQVSDIKLSFGHVKTTNNSSNELAVSVSTDGTTWTPLTYSRATGSGTSSWILIETAEAIPSTANLRIKFDNANMPTGAQFRIDDVKLTYKTLAVEDLNNTKVNLVKNTIVSNEISFGQAAKVSIVNMNGQIVKTADVLENGTLNISHLSKGTYVVTANVNGKSVSQKIIKK